jgi:hypothetical protein
MMDVAFGGKVRHPEGRYMSLTLRNDFPLEAIRHVFGLDVTLGLGFC